MRENTPNTRIIRSIACGYIIQATEKNKLIPIVLIHFVTEDEAVEFASKIIAMIIR
jgi:hypothetical protein